MKNIFIALFIIPQVVFAVYGEDNRKDFFEVQDNEVRELSKAILYRIDKHELRGWTFQRYWKIITKKLEDKGVCKDEKFSDQDTIRIGCSAVLIGKKKVLTGGNCISSFTCNNDLYYWTFGYYKGTSDQSFEKLHKKNFFKCKEIVKRVYDPASGRSFAIFTLKKDVKGIKPVKVSTVPLKDTDELIIMGHPSGLPLKIAEGAAVIDQDQSLFISNSDIRGETVGSMAFNKKTKELVGLLIYGTYNYQYSYETYCNQVSRSENNQAQELFLKSNIFSEYLE
jgi:V8-like Glu-specific endopeptidase